MNTLSPLRLAMTVAIALSPFSFTQIAQAAPGSVVVPTIPSSGSWSAPSQTTPQPGSAIVVPVIPSGNSPIYPSTPSPTFPPVSNPVTSPNRLPPVPTRPSTNRPVTNQPPIVQTPANGTIYRVVIADTGEALQLVKTVVPGAFRTSINGRSLIQAGLFREQSKAIELQQFLIQSNIQANILTGSASDVAVNPPRVTSPQPGDNSAPLPSVPKTGTRVVIDPGHGGGDPGAIGIGGLREGDATLDISRQVVSLLKQQGIDATLTRTRDEEIDLEPRVQFAERANADVFVSIHANSFDADRTDVNGIETYYYSGGTGQRLAQLVQSNLLQDLGARDRGVRTANFYVIKYTSMPAILVETGFVTGREDAARLASPTGRSQIAKAIARGILQYVGQGVAKR